MTEEQWSSHGGRLTATLPRVAPRLSAVAEAGRWYALCGERLYCAETLAGTFPDMGWHEPGEMGGLWAPPIKLLDGYWIGVRRAGGELFWLDAPLHWEMGEDGVTFTYDVPALNLRATRRAWIIPGESALVVELFLAALTRPAIDDDTPLEVVFLARSDLRGAWRSEDLGHPDGVDHATFSELLDAAVMWDALQPDWSVCVGATTAPFAHLIGTDVWGPERTSGKGTGAALWYRCAALPTTMASTQHTSAAPSLRFVIAGPARNGEAATALFSRYARPAAAPVGDTQALLATAQTEAAERFARPFESCVLRSPRRALDEAFAWAKATASWMMLDVPGLGRGPMGGIADFPWWFGCDTAYGVLALLPFGQGADASDSLRTLARLSQQHNGNGRVLHEVISNGVIFNPGNLVEVPLFARALYHTYRWTGDRALLADLFPFCLEGVLGYALGSELEVGEVVPQGNSIAETPDMHGGVQTLDVAAYLMESLDLLSLLARDLGQFDTATDLRIRAQRMRAALCDEWWMPEEDAFGDLRASVAELAALLARLEAVEDPDESVRLSIGRLRGALAQPEATALPTTRRQPWHFGHYVSVLAAEAGLPSPAQAEALLARLETPEWTTPYGIVLNALTDRRVMTLPTGAMAIAEARYGRADAALSYIERLAATTGQATPGTMSEFSPTGGCFLQLWSSYGVIWPIVHSIFGIQPDVATRQVRCAPNLPMLWPAAELDAIPLGDARFSCAVHATAEGISIRMRASDPEWKVTLGLVVPSGVTDLSATLNATPVDLLRADEDVVAHTPPTWVAPAVSGATEYILEVNWAADDTSLRGTL